jgi:hypothetical protein
VQPVRRLFALAAALLVLSACGGKKVQAVRAQLVATPGTLEFGKVPVLQHKRLVFTVQNQGRAPLNVSALALAASSSPAFALEGTLPKQILAGASSTVDVVYTPPGEEGAQGTLHLATDDPDQPALDVALHGEGSTRGAIRVHAAGKPGQAGIDFGRIGEGQVALQGVEIESHGTADLVVDGLTLEGPGVTFQSSSKTPVTVASGQSITLQLAYAPPEGAPTPLSGTLTVHSTDPDQVSVVVPLTARVNRAPVAAIADPGPVAPGQVVQLDGSASHDLDGDNPIAFADSQGGPGWSLVRTPLSSTATFTTPSGPRPQVTLDLPGQYVARLVVTDSSGLQTLHPAERTLIAKPAEALAVELVWDNADTDLDLHVLPHGAALGGAQDCWANNKQPDLGVLGDPSDDPVLLRDALDHFGPEYMVYVRPVSDTYDVDVNFYSAHGSPTPATTATIRIYVYGEVVAELSRQIPSARRTWFAATVAWPSGAVSRVDALP